MKPLFPPLLAFFLLLPVSAWADDAPQGPGCGLVTSALISQDQGQVMINCVGVSEEMGDQLAGVLTFVLQHRLDPQIAVAKLNEIEGAPADGAPRTLSADQAQTLVQGLVGKPSATIAVIASPDSKDAGDYALAIATKLQIAGWQIEGRQVRRTAPQDLADIPGLALVVHDEKAPPEAALQLKQAMAAAKIYLPIISDPSLGKDAELLWIGKLADLDGKS